MLQKSRPVKQSNVMQSNEFLVTNVCHNILTKVVKNIYKVCIEVTLVLIVEADGSVESTCSDEENYGK